MQLSKEDKFHLFARAAFFAHDREIPSSNEVDKVVYDLVNNQPNDQLKYDLPKFDWKAWKKKSPLQRQNVKAKWREQTAEINQIWIQRMLVFQQGFIEKMTLFWSGHFACRTRENPYETIDYNNRLRQHALGNFRDLLFAVSESSAMISYLHLKQNKKGKPNEDFARELCELFTLGRDVDYTEKDVSEIARAFTGWRVDYEGNHIVQQRQHDEGQKTIFGKTGHFSGADVLNMILENRNSAVFIAKKIYRFFVREQLNDDHVQELAQVFYDANYDIKSMMHHLFKAPWFYESKGELIKSPIELLVSFGRIFDLKYPDQKTLYRIQKNLGQVLFDPPNVAGWPGGRSWIDSSRLAFRLRLGSLMINKGVVEDELSPELDERLRKKRKKTFLKFEEEVDWDALFRKNKNSEITAVLIRSNNPHLSSLGENSERQRVIQLISTPDFQLT